MLAKWRRRGAIARPVKPWWRELAGLWMVKLGGKQLKLLQGPKDEAYRVLAEEKFVELRKLRCTTPEAVISGTGGAQGYDLLTVVMHELGLGDLPASSGRTLMTNNLSLGEGRVATTFGVEKAEELVTLTPAPTSEVIPLTLAPTPQDFGPQPSSLAQQFVAKLPVMASAADDDINLHGVQIG